MNEIKLDARGMACPKPVLETRKALGNHEVTRLIVMVDNDAAAENVTRMARSMGCEVSLGDQGDGNLQLTLTRESPALGDLPGEPGEFESGNCGTPSRVAVFLGANTIGRGDDALGRLLMIAFVKTLKELVPRPTSLLLMNSGVQLTLADSPVLEALKELSGAGIEILVCGTCLDFYNAKDSLGVGQISNMFEISSRMVGADKLIRP